MPTRERAEHVGQASLLVLESAPRRGDVRGDTLDEGPLVIGKKSHMSDLFHQSTSPKARKS